MRLVFFVPKLRSWSAWPVGTSTHLSSAYLKGVKKDKGQSRLLKVKFSSSHKQTAAKMASSKSQFGGIFLTLILGTCYHLTHGERILLLPYAFTSHVRQFAIIGDDLVDNGHEVYMVITSNFPDLHRFQGGKVRPTKKC